MKTKVFRPLVLAITFALLACLIAIPMTASAEEMFPGSSLRWVVRSYGGQYYWTKVNADNLSSTYSGQVDSAVYNWMHNDTLAFCTRESFTDSNVDLVSASSDWWSSHVSNPLAIAMTVPTDTNGLTIWNSTDASNSNGQISYAAIYFNPSGMGLDNTEKLQTIVHEIGHVYGMGHTSRTDSIMYPTVSDVTQLTDYDDSVMNSFYY